jgi:hypothetical protein
MKTLMMLTIVLVLSACSKKNETTTTPGADDVPAGNLVAQGTFTNGAHPTSGSVKIYDDNGTKKLRLENFKTDNGPDLKVYLAKDINAVAFMNIANLRSVNGNQNYSLSGMPDFKQYRYVLIWCQQFGVLFGSALIQ